MGTDISLFVEFKPFDEWWGVADSEFFVWRRYSFFAHLAGVRNYDDFPPIAADRGVPEDASQDVRSAWHDDGGHSASWCTPEEFREAAEKSGALTEDRPDIRAIVALAEAHTASGTPVRMVYWFDC